MQNRRSRVRSGSRLHDSVPSRPAATSELLGRGAGPSALMNRIALAGKIIARRLSRAGLMEGSSDLPETLMQENPSKDGCLCQ